MNNIESILYPALMLIAGIALSLFVTALEKRWDDWRDRRRKDKFGLLLAFRGGVSDPKLHCKENFEPPSGSGKGTPNRANAEKARSPCSSFGDVLYELGSKGGIQKRQSAGTL